MMEELNELFNITGGIVTTILLPLFGVFMFYDSKKRKAAAEARKAEADNITSYAAEWKELYEKKEHRVVELDSKIDQLYAEKNEDRQRIRELTEKNATLEIEKIKLEAKAEATERLLIRGKEGVSQRLPSLFSINLKFKQRLLQM